MADRPAVKYLVRVHQAGYTYDEVRRIWTASDSLGYYGATLYDLMNAPALECWTTLSALAAVTRRIRLMPLVLANLYRSPGLLAKMGATLDVISGGRLELGIGAGGDGKDHRAYGLTFPNTPRRVEMLEEAITCIRGLWSTPRFSFDGRFYQFDDAICAPSPLQDPHPPVLVGGHGRTHLLRAVARHGDICNMGFEMGLAEHKAMLEVLEEHCRQVGRDVNEIEVSHNTRVKIAATEDGVRSMLAEGAKVAGVSVGKYRQSLKNAIVGTPEQCAAQIQAYVGAGVDRFFLIFPDPINTDTLELFAFKVMHAEARGEQFDNAKGDA